MRIGIVSRLRLAAFGLKKSADAVEIPFGKSSVTLVGDETARAVGGSLRLFGGILTKVDEIMECILARVFWLLESFPDCSRLYLHINTRWPPN
jgi:hypothetical protein